MVACDLKRQVSLARHPANEEGVAVYTAEEVRVRGDAHAQSGSVLYLFGECVGSCWWKWLSGLGLLWGLGEKKEGSGGEVGDLRLAY